MDPAEKRKMLDDLERGSQALRDAVLGVSEEQAALRPGPDRWSVLDCVEHLAAVEEYLLGQLEAATPALAPVGSALREARIAERAGDRSRPVPAPESVRPRARFATLAEAVQCFESVRGRTVRFVECCEKDLRREATTQPLIGAVNCHEVLLIMALHPTRHAKQIAEIRGL
ncbi:MAG: DinB family protein [Bryobacteraceae bacterium]